MMMVKALMRCGKWTLAAAPFLAVPGIASAATQALQVQQGHVEIDRSGPVAIFRVTVVDRTATAINYRHRSGSTNVDFRGTALMPEAKGLAEVNSKSGRIQINAEMEHMTPATQFGPEYLTYVLWAITPEGRPKNLGEVLIGGGSKAKMEVTTDLQTFGLIVTAEPYFAVTQPSDVVVMENFVRSDTQGTFETIDAKYELLQRGQYVLNVNPNELAMPLDRKVPLELYEARNAVRIARWTGADKYATDTYEKAKVDLQNAEEEQSGKIGKKTVAQNSRDAAQTAEDARLIAIRRMQEEADANERAASAQREADAKSQAESAEAQARVQRQQAEMERSSADRAKAEAERAKAEAQAATDQATRAKSEAEAAQAAAQSSQAQLDSARQAAAQAELEKAQLREQIRVQLNTILETRETARGLIVNLSDVLFDSGKFTLKSGAREKLAKIAGIILAHQGLNLQVEGHTDSIGDDAYNQRLSEQRANTVREYLVAQGVVGGSITARGFGKTQPVTGNDTAAGRQQNRRVELVVSGDAIGGTMAQQGQQ